MIWQVILGAASGALYSILGWLKNQQVPEKIQLSVDEKLLREAFGELTEEKKRELLKAGAMVFLFFKLQWSKFDKRQFLEAVIYGLAVGLIMGLLGVPYEAAETIATQLGLIYVLRKLIGIFKK